MSSINPVNYIFERYLRNTRKDNLQVIIRNSNAEGASYIGVADYQALTSDPSWAIFRIAETGTENIILPGDEPPFSMVWDNYSTYFPDDLPQIPYSKNTKVDLANISRTPFNELKTVGRYAQIELKSAVDSVSNLRNYVQSTNGSVTVANTGEYLAAVTANANAEVVLESGERGRYIPGYEAEVGCGIRIPATTTWAGTSFGEWGYFDGDNGFGFGVDAAGIYVFIDRIGVRTAKVYQADWNGDRLDGFGGDTNPSGLSIDLSDGNIFQIEYVWYGYGPIEWIVNIKNIQDRKKSTPVVIHTELPDKTTSIAQPNLPISVKINNGDSAVAREIFVGGRQYSVYGRPNERFRVNGEVNTNISVNNTSWTPLVSFRRKAGTGNNQSVELTALNIIPDGNIYYTFVTNGTLTGASFGNFSDVSPDETAVEVDTSATAITGGTFFGGVYLATGNNQANVLATLQQLDFDFVNSDEVTLVCKSVGASATVEAVALNVREQW